MQDLMSKLQSVLGDEQSMKQLSEIASALSSETPEQASAGNAQPDFSQLLKSLNLEQPQQAQPAAPANSGLDVSKLLALQTENPEILELH